MMLLRGMCLSKYSPKPVGWCDGPLQLAMGGCPWMVAVSSMMLCRTRRTQAEPVVREVFLRYPTPGDLCRADGLENLLRPCGLHCSRARRLRRFSSTWFSEWAELYDLPGVGAYVHDAVGLFCFGCTDLESNDRVLRSYVERLHEGEAVGP